MYKSKNFFIVPEVPETKAKHAKVFYGNVYFANTWQNPADFGGRSNKWEINRHDGAFAMGLEATEFCFDSPDLLLEYLENWLEKKS